MNCVSEAVKAKPHIGPLLVLCAAVWGLTFPAGKIASLQASPLNATLWRFIIASILLIPLAMRISAMKFKDLRARDFLGLALSGLTGLVLYNFFFIKGLSMIPASRGAVIVCGSPALIYLGAVIFFGEKLTLTRCLGVLISAFGTAYVITMGRPLSAFSGGLGAGDIIMLGCPLSWTAYSLIGRVVLKRISPLDANTWSVLAAVILILVTMPITHEPIGQAAIYSLKTWTTLAFLGLGGTALGFTLFYMGISNIGPHRAAAYINLVPVFGILYGWLMFRETPDSSLIIGLIMILAGLRLVQKY